MRTTTVDPTSLFAAERTIPKDTPILMLNLLRWKQHADYSGQHTALAPCTGQEAYMQRYVPAFNTIVAGIGIEGIGISFLGAAVADLVTPPEEHWDVVVLVRYPSFAAFRTVVESDEYKATAQHHRLAALEDWRLIATVEMGVS